MAPNIRRVDAGAENVPQSELNSSPFPRDWRGVVAIFFSIGAAVPLLAATPAPLQDWPGHLARVDILRQMLDGSAFWQRFYALNGFLLPDIAQDGSLLLIQRLGISLDVAGASFLLLNYALFVSGFCRLAASFRSSNETTPLLGSVLFYGGPLFWGFVSYVAGVGLLLWLVALWMDRAESPTVRLIVATVGSAAIFYFHVVPAFLFAGILGCIDLRALAISADPPARRVARNATSLAAAATTLLLLKLAPIGHDDLFTVKWVGDDSIKSFLYWKASLVGKTLLGGNPVSDLVLCVMGALLAAFLPFTARMRVSATAMLIVLALTVLTFAAPQRVGSGSFFDYRLAFVALVFIVAGCTIEWRRGRTAVFVLLCFLVAVRSGALIVGWYNAGQTFAALDREFAVLPAGSILLSVFDRPIKSIAWREWWSLPVGRIDSLAERHGLFVPTVPANENQHALMRRAPFKALGMASELGSTDRLRDTIAAAMWLCPVAREDHPDASVFIFVLYPTPGVTGDEGRPLVHGLFRLIDVCADTAR